MAILTSIGLALFVIAGYIGYIFYKRHIKKIKINSINVDFHTIKPEAKEVIKNEESEYTRLRRIISAEPDIQRGTFKSTGNHNEFRERVKALPTDRLFEKTREFQLPDIVKNSEFRTDNKRRFKFD